MTALVVGLGACVALLAVLVVGLLRSHAEILRALHDLGVNLEDGSTGPRSSTTAPGGAPPRSGTASGIAEVRPGPLGGAADLSGELPGGGVAHVPVRDVEHATLLAFLSTGCGTCAEFWRTADDVHASGRLGARTRLVILTNGADAESPALVADMAPAGPTTIMSTAAWDAYGVPVSPYFVLVDGPSGTVVGEGSGHDWDQVLGLLDKAQADLGARRRGARRNGAQRAADVDAALIAAGIEPGDPSLHRTDEEGR